MAMGAPIKVYVVDDHPIIRDGLAQLIGREQDMQPCGGTDNATTALDEIQHIRPDVAVVDISLEGSINGLQLIKQLRELRNPPVVLVLSMHDESLYAERALRAGARGYITKHEATKKVVTAIRSVLAGDVYLSTSSASRIMDKLVGYSGEREESPVERLSDRELEVLKLIGQGFRTGQIADSLSLSVKTIETYRENIKQKLSLRDATELVRFAIEWVHSDIKGDSLTHLP